MSRLIGTIAEFVRRERYTEYMKLGMNFAIFVLFFGIAALQAFRTQDWLYVSFWVVVGLIFLWADRKKDS